MWSSSPTPMNQDVHTREDVASSHLERQWQSPSSSPPSPRTSPHTSAPATSSTTSRGARLHPHRARHRQIAAARGTAPTGAHSPGRGQRRHPLFQLKTVRLATVTAEPVRWLWKGHVALGKMNMLDGLPDVGKSTIGTDLAARTTKGKTMPDGQPDPYLSRRRRAVHSRGRDRRHRPSLPMQPAAIPEKIYVVEAMITTTGATTTERWPDPRNDTAALEDAVKARSAKPSSSMSSPRLGANTDMHCDFQDIRSVLGLLAAMAERAGRAVLLLRHPDQKRQPRPRCSPEACVNRHHRRRPRRSARRLGPR